MGYSIRMNDQFVSHNVHNCSCRMQARLYQPQYTTLLRTLNNESTPLNSVDQDEAALEERVVAPGANEVKAAAVGLAVVLGVHVEEANLLDEAAGGVLRQRADVDDVQAGAVVALVREAVDDELVVVDAVHG